MMYYDVSRIHLQIFRKFRVGIAEFAGLDFAGLENDGLENDRLKITEYNKSLVLSILGGDISFKFISNIRRK